jgi:predicted negative regulator of RcsB-dependent stress response
MWPWSRTPASPAPREACSFCRRPAAELRRLTATAQVSICEACAAAAVGALAAPGGTGGTPDLAIVRETLRATLARLGPDAPFAVSGPLVRAAAALATTRAERHNLALEALRLRNPDAALVLLDVPDATPTMLANAAACWVQLGRADHAVARLQAVEVAALPPIDRAHHATNLAAALLERGAPDDEVAPLLELAEHELAAAGEDPHVAAWRGCVEDSRGDLALRRGEARTALLHYRRALARRGEVTGTSRRVGDALSHLGDAAGAREAWQAALAAAHPEGSEATVLRQRLGVPGAN